MQEVQPRSFEGEFAHWQRESQRRAPKRIVVEFDDGTSEEYSSIEEAMRAQQTKKEQVH